MWVNDIAAYYHHFRLDEAARPFYSFEYNKEYYALMTIPTGQRQCVALAQLMSLFLAEENRQEYKLERIDVYVDNFFGASKTYQQALDQAISFAERAKKYGITLNEIPEVHTQNVTHRGVVFNQASAEVTERMRAKLTFARQIINENICFREAQQIFGICSYATRINGEFEFYAYYYVYKFMRRRQKEGLDPRAEAKVWKSIIPQWKQWISKILLSKRIPKERLPTYLIVSDASDTGWGGYRFSPFDAPRIFSGQWNHHDKDLHINAKELLALHYTAQDIPQGSQVRVWVDNTTAIQAIQNRRSRSFTLNKLVTKLEPSSFVSDPSVE